MPERVLPEAWLKASGPIQRIIFHWTAGGYNPSAFEKLHYHLLIGHDGKAHRGARALGQYLPHVKRLNTGSVGLALCGMRGAVESPRRMGDAPITLLQLERACQAAAEICYAFELPISERTVLTHSEVPAVYGIPQNRWDIDWLCWDSSINPKGVHALIRRKTAWYLQQLRSGADE